MLDGMNAKADPGARLDGEATADDGAPLPRGWSEAITAFQASPFIQQALGAEFTRVYTAMKWQELDGMASHVSDIEHIVTSRIL